MDRLVMMERQEIQVLQGPEESVVTQDQMASMDCQETMDNP